MLAAGLLATINTDDPSVSRITLSQEYQHISEDLGVSLENIRQCILNASVASFMPDVEKREFVSFIKQELKL
jgi:adenosine deaminase